uniref:Golgin subfamily A member 4 n=1 Tax=Cacopsylla melanoneura TaxID=428564 RepID=A0A8D8SE50_9HEMI
MFKKLKDKITEEVKSAPRNLFQPSVQQPLQAVTPQTSNESFSSDLDKSSSDINKSFEHAASPEPGGFTSIDLRSPPDTRKSSLIFPVESPPYLQSDLESASEVESSLCSSQRLGHITKESLYSSYQQVHSKYQKYKGRYVEMSKAYKKLEAVMGESQDKILRKNAELKEQCQLEQKAKAHLEEMLRNDLEEKDHIINTLNTKINLLKGSEESIATKESGFDEMSKTKTEDYSHSLIELNDSNVSSHGVKNNAVEGKSRLEDIEALRSKLTAAEQKISEHENSMKQLEETLEVIKQKENSSSAQLLALRTELQEKTNEINQLKEKQDVEKVTLAENKINFHKELESKDILMAELKIQIGQLNEEKLRLKDQMSNMEADWKEKETVTRKKLEAVELLRQELQKKMEIETSLHVNLEAKDKECLKLKQKLTTTEQQNLELKQMFEATEKECSEFKHKCEATEKEALEYKQKLEAREVKCSDIKQKLEVSERECLESKHKMEELENTLETLRTSNDEMIRNLERELSTASSDNCIEQELNQLRDKMKRLEEQSDSELRELKSLHQKDIEEEKSKYNELIKQIGNSLKSKENEIVRTLEEKDKTIYKLNIKLQTLHDKFSVDKTKAETILKNEISKLKEKLNAVNEENVDFKKVTEKLENSLKEKDQTISEMTNEREEMNVQKELKEKTDSIINTLQENIKLLKKEKDEANATNQANIEDLKITNSNLHQELVSLNAKQAEVNEKYQALVEKCKLLETIQVSLNETIEELTSGKETGNNEVAKLKSKMLETFEENKKLKDQLTSIESERLKDAALVEKHKQTINNLKGDISTLETNVSQTLPRELESKTKKVTQLEHELERVKTQLARVESALDDKNEQEKVLTKKLTELLPELEKLQAIIDAKTSENNKLKNEWNQKDTLLKSIAKKLIYVYGELKSTKDLHRNICDTLKNMDDPRSKLKEIDNVLEQIKSNARHNIVNLNEGLKKEEEFKIQLSNVYALNEELKEKINELTKEKENNEIKQEGYIKKIEHYENILNEKKNEFNTQQDLEHQYKANIEQLELDNANLVKRISELKKEYEVKIEESQQKIKQVLEELNSKIYIENKLKKDLENMKTINQEQEEKVRTLVITEIKANFNEEKKKLELTIENLNANMKKCKRDLKLGLEEKEKLRITVESKEKEISLLQEHKKEIQDKYSTDSERLGMLVTENETLCKEKDLLQEKHDQLSNQITTLRESYSKSKESMEKINLLTKENGQLLLEKEELSKSVATLQKKVEENSLSQNLELKQLQDELVNYKELYDELNSKLTEHVDKISTLGKEKSELFSEKENIRVSLAKLQDEIDNKILLQNQTSAQLSESHDEVKKLKDLNTDLSLKSKDFLEQINKLTRDHDELALEKDRLGNLVTKLQGEIEENKVSVQNSSQMSELQNEVASCKNLNMELKNSRDKFRASVDKLANYLKVPLIRPNPASSNQIDIDMDVVIEKFKTLQVQVKNKEKNDSDFFMLTLEDELKKERILNKSLEKDLKIEKEKQLKVLESNNKHEENLNNLNMKQLQTSCSKVKNEFRDLREFSIEQLDEFTKEFINMKMNLIQGVINCNGSSISNSLIQNDSSANSEALKKTLNEEHKAQIRRLVSEFKQELAAKEEEVRSLEGKQFDRRDAEEFYINNELKRSIMNLEEENQTLGNSLEELTLQIKQMKTDHSVQVSKLVLKNNEDMKALETKWKEWMRNKLDDKEEKFKEEIDALSNEWQLERKEIFEVDTMSPMVNNEELESRQEKDSNIHKNLAKLTLELSQVKKQHKEEVKELRRLLNLGNQSQVGEEESTSECEGEGGGDEQKGGKGKDQLGSCLELEYLRNVLFEYMMGKEPLVLARVLAAIVKFDPEHTVKVLQREEQKMSMVSQLSHTYMKFS